VSDDISLRGEFLLDPNVTFLNHGSFGACPRSVFERYQELQLELERQPVLFIARRLDGLLAHPRCTRRVRRRRSG
jgi:isopenicillin-N epimerase